MTELADPFAEVRAHLATHIQLVGNAVIERFKPLIDKANEQGQPQRAMMLFRQMVDERERVTSSLVRRYAELPPAPMSIFLTPELYASLKGRGILK